MISVQMIINNNNRNGCSTVGKSKKVTTKISFMNNQND